MVTPTTSAMTRIRLYLTLRKRDQQLRVSLHFVRRSPLLTAPLATEVQKPASAFEAHAASVCLDNCRCEMP